MELLKDGLSQPVLFITLKEIQDIYEKKHYANLSDVIIFLMDIGWLRRKRAFKRRIYHAD